MEAAAFVTASRTGTVEVMENVADATAAVVHPPRLADVGSNIAPQAATTAVAVVAITGGMCEANAAAAALVTKKSVSPGRKSDAPVTGADAAAGVGAGEAATRVHGDPAPPVDDVSTAWKGATLAERGKRRHAQSV